MGRYAITWQEDSVTWANLISSNRCENLEKQLAFAGCYRWVLSNTQWSTLEPNLTLWKRTEWLPMVNWTLRESTDPYDIVRIDHFRGFGRSYYNPTMVSGAPGNVGPGYKLFATRRRDGDLNIWGPWLLWRDSYWASRTLVSRDEVFFNSSILTIVSIASLGTQTTLWCTLEHMTTTQFLDGTQSTINSWVSCSLYQPEEVRIWRRVACFAPSLLPSSWRLLRKDLLEIRWLSSDETSHHYSVVAGRVWQRINWHRLLSNCLISLRSIVENKDLKEVKKRKIII